MKIHPTTIKGFDTLEDAAVAVGKMRYDAISVFLRHLVSELSVQQDKDAIVGKTELVKDMNFVLESLTSSEALMAAIFRKYKHHMVDELDITPEVEYD